MGLFLKVVGFFIMASSVIGLVLTSRFGGSFANGVLIDGFVALLLGAGIYYLGAKRGATGRTTKCPHCAERILAEAKVCKHCGKDVVPVAT